MKLKPIYLFCFLFLSIESASQTLLKGVVLDAEKNKPVSNASVFLNNTSVGTKADEHGIFVLSIPNGKFELIVSSVGYQTYNQTISGNEIADFITIKLQVKTQLMETVVVEPYEKDGWQKWGKFFIENFIGMSANAKDCEIKNSSTIHFTHPKNKNTLSAVADETLIIENKALGYTIHYQLESFQYDFKNNYLVWTGYPFFEPMKGSKAMQKRREKKRNEAYYGSMMHFMRTVYRNKIVEEGFEIRHLKKIPNYEKQRVKEAYKSNMQTIRNANGTATITHINKDTAEYYGRIMRQTDYFDVIEKTTLPGDSIAYAVNNTTAGLDFKDYLLIVYKKATAPSEYRKQFPESNASMMSQIVLVNGIPVEIEANGLYYNPVDLMSLGYWAWSEKIATMLPFDYQLPSDFPR